MASDWASLPDELLVCVFGFVPQRGLLVVSHVCRSWRRAACDPMLWRSCTLTNTALGELEVLGDRLGHVRQLALPNCTSLAKTVSAVRGVCPLVESLVLDGTKLDAAASVRLLGDVFGVRLNTLYARRCGLSDETVGALGQALRGLTSVSLAANDAITDGGLAALAAALPADQLACLDVSSNYALGDGGLGAAVRAHGGALHTLQLNGCFRLTDAGLRDIRGAQLRCLELDDCTRLSAGLVGSLIQTACVGLRVLSLNHLAQLDDAALLPIGSCAQLRSLYLQGTGCGPTALCAIAHGCPLLSALSIGETAVDEASLLVLCSHARALRFLHVSGLAGFSDAVLVALASHEPPVPLHTLVCTACHALTDAGVCAALPVLRTLMLVDLWDVPGVSAAAVARLRAEAVGRGGAAERLEIVGVGDGLTSCEVPASWSFE